MHWETLDLDRFTATAKEVKRAYARRLKTCRPDQDPEGFRNLHAAYTAALRELEWRDAREAPAGIPGSHERETPAPADLSPQPQPGTEEAEKAWSKPADVYVSPDARAVLDAIDAVECELRQPSPAGIGNLMRQAETALYDHPSEVARWGALMARLLRLPGNHPELRLLPQALIFELEHDGWEATFAVIERIETHARQSSVRGICSLILDQAARLANPASGQAGARLAMSAAVWEPAMVDELCDFAYPRLPVGEREPVMHRIDQYRAMGELLEPVPPAWKSFWIARFSSQEDDYDWADEKSRAAIDLLRTPQARCWGCYAAMKSLLPKAEADSLALPSRVPPATRSSSSGGGSIPLASSGSSRPVPPARRSAYSRHDSTHKGAWREEMERESKRIRTQRPSTVPTRAPGYGAGSRSLWAVLVILVGLYHLFSDLDPHPIYHDPAPSPSVLPVNLNSPEIRRGITELQRVQERREKQNHPEVGPPAPDPHPDATPDAPKIPPDGKK